MPEPAVEPAEGGPSRSRPNVAHAWLGGFVFAELEAEAQRRRIHPDRLTAQIVEKAICRGLVDELLG